MQSPIKKTFEEVIFLSGLVCGESLDFSVDSVVWIAVLDDRSSFYLGDYTFKTAAVAATGSSKFCISILFYIVSVQTSEVFSTGSTKVRLFFDQGPLAYWSEPFEFLLTYFSAKLNFRISLATLREIQFDLEWCSYSKSTIQLSLNLVTDKRQSCRPGINQETIQSDSSSMYTHNSRELYRDLHAYHETESHSKN